jgi:ABC-type multidrug transport system fused ATPase/permease subunit
LDVIDKKPSANWPSKGEIIMNRVVLQYGEEAPVLKEISLVIRQHEKVWNPLKNLLIPILLLGREMIVNILE